MEDKDMKYMMSVKFDGTEKEKWELENVLLGVKEMRGVIDVILTSKD